MTEGREQGAVLEGGLDERLVKRAFEAAAAGPRAERVRNAVETALDIAEEAGPQAVHDALCELRGDPDKLQWLEAGVGMTPERATLAVGAVIQLSIVELASANPDLRSRKEELVRWLEGDW
jgi:hypothetical protein